MLRSIVFNKGLIIVVSLLLVMVMSLSFHQGVSAQAIDDQTKQDACAGLEVAGSGCDNTSGSGVTGLIAAVINILSWVVGIAAVIMIIVGGFRYVTSAGDSNNVSAAKSTILYAVIGLVIAILAQVIVQFVLRRVTTP